MAQYDIPFLQEDANGRFAQVTLAPNATGGALETAATTRVPNARSVAFGHLYVEDNVTATTIAAPNTWVKFVAFTTSDVGVEVVPSVASNQITITTSGYYLVGFQVSFSGTLNNIIEWEVQTTTGTRFKATHSDVKLPATGDITQCGASNVVALTAGQILALYVNNNTGANNITARDVGLYVVRLA